jgi:cardiolipin synthase
MYGASKTINIENAYFVALPVVTQAVLDARARGVEVNILTNSAESIDSEGKPIVDAMAECLVPLYQAGVKIYLKQGAEQTLHSKFMTVDGEFASIGSYNLHPRGERSDSEMNVNILGREAVAQLDGAFAHDLSVAKPVKSLKDITSKPGLVSYIMTHYFYSQLSAPIPGAADLAN